MREIKFLAYVNNPIHGKGVFPVKSIHFDPFVCEIVMGDEIVNFFDFDDIALLEYTGLKDKNGKEIYAGDIIRYEYLEDSCWGKAGVYTGHIRFDKGGFEIVHHGDRIIRYPDGSWYEPSKCDDMKSFMSWAHNVEVIGNRYTHPHLLDGEEEWTILKKNCEISENDNKSMGKEFCRNYERNHRTF